MRILLPILPHVAFLALALLAAVVAGLAASRALRPDQARPGRGIRDRDEAAEGEPHQGALNLGAAVFLGQFLGFVALAALGLPSILAQGAALSIGVAASMANPGPA